MGEAAAVARGAGDAAGPGNRQHLLAGGLNGASRLNASTVHDEITPAADTLIGDAAGSNTVDDWVFVFPGDTRDLATIGNDVVTNL